MSRPASAARRTVVAFPQLSPRPPAADRVVDEAEAPPPDLPAGAAEAPGYERPDLSALSLYSRDVGRHNLLTPEEELKLARAMHKGDKRARERMICGNLRLVIKIARDYENLGLPLVDLIAEGNVGLMKAVDRFDPNKGARLGTYAAWWIRQCIKSGLARHGRTMRLPAHLIDRFAQLRRTAGELTTELGREPTNEELAEVLSISVQRVVQLKVAGARWSSLDAPLREDAESALLGEIIGDENAVSPADAAREGDSDAELRAVLAELPPREAEILRLRFGLDGDGERTLEEIGQRMRVTRERVRQLQELALRKLRRKLQTREVQRTREDIEADRTRDARLAVFREFARSSARVPLAAPASVLPPARSAPVRARPA